MVINTLTLDIFRKAAILNNYIRQMLLTVRHQQLSRNITRSYAHQCQFDDTPPDAIWKWSTIHKYTAQLVHTCLTCKDKPRQTNFKNVKKNKNLLNINKMFEKKYCFFKMTDKSYSSPKIIYYFSTF